MPLLASRLVEHVNEAFFSGLQQQPRGPHVVQTVELLLERVAELETSEEVGAQAVRNTLRARGFDREANAIRGVLTELSAHQLPEQPTELEAVGQSLQAQRTAHEDLRDWYYDVATMLRPHYNKRERIALGMSRPRGGNDSTADELGADVAESHDAELDQE